MGEGEGEEREMEMERERKREWGWRVTRQAYSIQLITSWSCLPSRPTLGRVREREGARKRRRESQGANESESWAIKGAVLRAWAGRGLCDNWGGRES